MNTDTMIGLSVFICGSAISADESASRYRLLGNPDFAEALRPFLGPADEAGSRFANETVVFKRGSVPDRVETGGINVS